MYVCNVYINNFTFTYYYNKTLWTFVEQIVVYGWVKYKLLGMMMESNRKIYWGVKLHTRNWGSQEQRLHKYAVPSTYKKEIQINLQHQRQTASNKPEFLLIHLPQNVAQAAMSGEKIPNAFKSILVGCRDHRPCWGWWCKRWCWCHSIFQYIHLVFFCNILWLMWMNMFCILFFCSLLIVLRATYRHLLLLFFFYFRVRFFFLVFCSSLLQIVANFLHYSFSAFRFLLDSESI